MAIIDVSTKLGIPVVLPVIGEWTTFTCTPLNLGAGSATVTAKYRRVGSSAEIYINLVKDATPGSGSSGVTLTLPTGITPVTVLNNTGVGSVYTNANPSPIVPCAVLAPSNVLFFGQTDGGSVGGAKFTASSIWTIEATIPIADWAGQAMVAYGNGLATSAKAGLVDPYNANGVVYSGTWTGVLTNGTNVSSSSFIAGSYIRLGNQVMVAFQITVTNTASAGALSLLELTLPVTSNLTAANDLNGTGTKNNTTPSQAIIYGSAANKRAVIQFYCQNAANESIFGTFMYTVK